MVKNQMGLTLLESLVVMLICIILLWVVIPVVLVREGWKEAGSMVVTEGDKAPENRRAPLDPEILKPRVKKMEPDEVITSGSTDLPVAPGLPQKQSEFK
jgi:hypothetical protein